MCQIPLLTTTFSIILVQATSISCLDFCLVSLLLPCCFFSSIIYYILYHHFSFLTGNMQSAMYIVSFTKGSPSLPMAQPLWLFLSVLGEEGTAQEPSAQVPLGPVSIFVCLSLRAPLESTLCRMTPACRPLPDSFGNYLTASRRNARLGFTLFEG